MSTTSNWNFRKSYFLCLMSFGYIIGEIAHFLIITTSRSVARDVQYGDQGCYGNATFPKEDRDANLKCESFVNASSCTAVSSNLFNTCLVKYLTTTLFIIYNSNCLVKRNIRIFA